MKIETIRTIAITILSLTSILLLISIITTKTPTPELKVTCQTNYTCNFETNNPPKNNIQANHNPINPRALEIMQQLDLIDNYGEFKGSSMQPTIFEGNTLLEKKYSNNTILKTGDIVRYYRFTKTTPDCNTIINNSNITDEAVIHRINAIYQDYILVQGDNLNEQENIQPCQITHKIIGVIYT